MMKDYDVKLYRGWPETSGDTLEEMLEKGSLMPVSDRGDGLYDLMPGIYSCHMTGEDIYPTLKVLSIKDDSIGICPKTLTENAVVYLRACRRDTSRPAWSLMHRNFLNGPRRMSFCASGPMRFWIYMLTEGFRSIISAWTRERWNKE